MGPEKTDKEKLESEVQVSYDRLSAFEIFVLLIYENFNFFFLFQQSIANLGRAELTESTSQPVISSKSCQN